jgi:hypothetical protein
MDFGTSFNFMQIVFKICFIVKHDCYFKILKLMHNVCFCVCVCRMQNAEEEKKDIWKDLNRKVCKTVKLEKEDKNQKRLLKKKKELCFN